MNKKLKKITIRDIFGIFKFLLVFLPALIYRLYLKIIKKELWLICETSITARDNGRVFFEYMMKKHPEIKTYYAIDKKCKDYNNISKYNNIINWASLNHYFLYISATKNISSHKEGNPNHSLFTVLHLYLHLFNNRVFLQHGVLYQNYPMFYKKNTKFKIFICGAKPEYDFVKENFGYKNEVKYTGLARFDKLYENKSDSNTILYMPTWRRWINTSNDLLESEYYKKIMEFINSDNLEKLLVKNNYRLLFCPHVSFKKYVNNFESKNKNVEIIDVSSTDVSELLKRGSILITDFSSVHTDFAYMYKPIIYYQYDLQEYQEKHCGNSKTYFDFEKNGFGKVCHNENDLIIQLANIIDSNNIIENKYLENINNFFPLHDKNNCERIFNVLRGDNND